MEQWKIDAFNHAEESKPLECCGILAKKNNKFLYWKCNNVAKDNPEYSFVIDPLDWADCEDNVDEIHGIVHSHPEGGNASEADKKACKATKIPWYVYLLPEDTWQIINP